LRSAALFLAILAAGCSAHVPTPYQASVNLEVRGRQPVTLTVNAPAPSPTPTPARAGVPAYLIECAAAEVTRREMGPCREQLSAWTGGGGL
jgi:hypothetical protein